MTAESLLRQTLFWRDVAILENFSRALPANARLPEAKNRASLLIAGEKCKFFGELKALCARFSAANFSILAAVLLTFRWLRYARLMREVPAILCE